MNTVCSTFHVCVRTALFLCILQLAVTSLVLASIVVELVMAMGVAFTCSRYIRSVAEVRRAAQVAPAAGAEPSYANAGNDGGQQVAMNPFAVGQPNTGPNSYLGRQARMTSEQGYGVY